uniref:Hepcidin n=1 Tax=Oncorhynchus kisutch TaxID=8019 RepID=A0A8C7FS30_ONCKI
MFILESTAVPFSEVLETWTKILTCLFPLFFIFFSWPGYRSISGSSVRATLCRWCCNCCHNKGCGFCCKF